MTVGELIAELMKLPSASDVRIVYDSQVCCEDIVYVGRWHNGEAGPHRANCIGVFDSIPEPDDDRIEWRREERPD